MIGNSTLSHTWSSRVGPTPAPLIKCGKLGSHRKNNNHSHKFVTYVTPNCEVCSKSLKISLQLNDHRCKVTLQSICIYALYYSHMSLYGFFSVQVFALTDSTCSLLCVLWIMYCTSLDLCLTGKRGDNVQTTWPYWIYYARKIYY